MARTYKRDSRGRFAGGGGGGKKPKTAAGRASANLRAAEKARVINPYDKKAANKAITAAAAKDYYKTMGGGRKGAASSAKKPAKPTSKAGQTRSANVATTKRLINAGLRGTGSRLRSKTGALYAGSKATKARNAELWSNVEGNQRYGAAPGAQRSKAKVGGTISRRR